MRQRAVITIDGWRDPVRACSLERSIQGLPGVSEAIVFVPTEAVFVVYHARQLERQQLEQLVRQIADQLSIKGGR